MAALDADKSSAAGAGDNSEELILELFDVLERCPAAARDAATDAALEAIAAAAAPEEPEEQVPEAVKSEPSSAAEAVLQTIDYDALLNSTDEKAVEAAVASAFGPNGLGVLAVTNVPAALTAKRRRLLRLGQKLGTLPDDVLKQYERPELCYCAGWSRGREKFRGQLDVAKGSWYANGLHSNIDDASLRERYPESTTEPQWPSPDLLGDSLEDAFRGLSRDLHALSRHVLRRCDAVAERALRKRGVAYETTLSEVVDRSRLHVGRLLHYFPRDASGTWCGWHNDNSIITALAPALFYDAAGSEVPAPPGAGLTALSRSGVQHRVAPPRGSVLFQIGEAAQILTAGALMATPHAVQAGELASCSREAFALFVEPAWDEPLDVPRGCARADALADYGETIPPLAKRLPRLPVAFAQFLADSVKEYY